MIDHVEQFRTFIAELGYEPQLDLEPGRLVRFPTNGKSSDDAGYAKLFRDCEGGIVGDWRTGRFEVWQAKGDRQLSEPERREWLARVKHEKRAAKDEEGRRHAEAAKQAQAIFSGSRPAPDTHPYLARKGIRAHGLHVYRGDHVVAGMRCDGALVVPARDTAGKIHTIEFIPPVGDDKRFLWGGAKAGHYFGIGKPNGVLCIAEGFATGASVHEATCHAVAVAFDAGNLEPVAVALRSKFPNIRLIVCADDDVAVEGNPGLTSATQAARAVGGLIAVPDFVGDRPEGATDFNDLAQIHGAEAIRKAVAEAKSPTTPEPLAVAGNRDANEPPQGGPVIICVADVKPEPIEWLWPERIAIGKLSLIAGDPGQGKSLLTLAIAAHVSMGSPWPVDHKACPQGDVLLLSAEDPIADTVRPRLDAAGADVSRIRAMTMMRDVDQQTGELRTRGFSLRRDLAFLRKHLALNPNCRVVIVDPVSAYLDGADSHNNADIRGLLAPLAELASKFRVAIVAVTHLNKGSGSNAMYRATGSLAFVAAARSVLAVTKDKQDASRRLVLPIKNNLGTDQTGLAYRIAVAQNGAPVVEWESDPVTVTADEALAGSVQDEGEDTAIGEAESWLREQLEGGDLDGKRIKGMAKDAGISERTLYRASKAIGAKTLSGGFARARIWHLCPMSAKECHVCQPQYAGTQEKSGTHGTHEAPSADHIQPETEVAV